MKKEIIQNNKGFTLVEALVAIAIFTLSILALMSVLASGISNTTYAKQKMIGTYLAQEGIEYIRNMRDTFVLYDNTSGGSQHGWDQFNAYLIKSPQSKCDNISNGCYVDDQNLDYANQNQPMTSIYLTACNDSTCSLHPILYDASNGRYSYKSGVDSGFTRKINVTQVVNGGVINEVKISSTVYWTQGSGNYSVTFSESLFNWVQ